MILKFKIGGIWVDILPKIKFHSKESIENWNCKQLKNIFGKGLYASGSNVNLLWVLSGSGIIAKNVKQSIHSGKRYFSLENAQIVRCELCNWCIYDDI